MTTGQLRRLHTKNIGILIHWVHENLPGYELQLEEGYINPVRVRAASGKPLVELNQQQYVHKLKGLHPEGRANDISLFVNGEYIQRSDDPRWNPVIEKWISIHQYCKSGRSGGDANHFSTDPGNKW